MIDYSITSDCQRVLLSVIKISQCNGFYWFQTLLYEVISSLSTCSSYADLRHHIVDFPDKFLTDLIHDSVVIVLAFMVTAFLNGFFMTDVFQS